MYKKIILKFEMPKEENTTTRLHKTLDELLISYTFTFQDSNSNVTFLLSHYP